MKRFDERDIDNLHAILDHCDRIEATYERIGESYHVSVEDSRLCRRRDECGVGLRDLATELREYPDD